MSSVTVVSLLTRQLTVYPVARKFPTAFAVVPVVLATWVEIDGAAAPARDRSA